MDSPATHATGWSLHLYSVVFLLISAESLPEILGPDRSFTVENP